MEIDRFMNPEPSLGQHTLKKSFAGAPDVTATDFNEEFSETPAAPANCLSVVRNALDDVKAQNVAIMDVRGITDVADTIIIASGTSTRHVKALANNVADEARKAGFRPIGIEGERDAEWILIDFGNLVVHVMLPTARTFYDLESLWKPAQKSGS